MWRAPVGTASNTPPAVQHDAQRMRPALPGGLETGDAVTLGSSFKSDDAVEVGGSINRAGVTDSGPSVRIDSYHPDETSQVRQRDSAPRFAARPVGVPLSDTNHWNNPGKDHRHLKGFSRWSHRC